MAIFRACKDFFCDSCDYEYHLMSVQYMSYHPRHNYDVHDSWDTALHHTPP